jgi:hypothetical protein
MPNFNRSLEELEAKGVKWWPDELCKKNAAASVVPVLLKSQDDFIHILCLCKKPFQVFDIIESAGMASNVFLKHLIVLSDFGGEPIKRLRTEFEGIFPKADSGEFYFSFTWMDSEVYTHEFLSIHESAKTTFYDKLKVDRDGLLQETDLTGSHKDMIAILLFAGMSPDLNEFTGKDKCTIGGLIGKKAELCDFIKRRYIEVSRITGGADANSLGQLAQSEVVGFLQKRLGNDCEVKRNGSVEIPGFDKGLLPFDITIRKGSKVLGVEVSFQVTTNSTVERKGQAAQRNQELMHQNGHKIGYIIDGSGNFARRNFVRTICGHSDCTVAYSEEEFEVLALWAEKELS